MTTASILTQLPLQLGNVFLSQLARVGHWTLSRYMKAPLASTGLLAMVTLTALAGSNALYFQTVDHPSPFFGPIRAVPASVSVDAPVPAPVSLREQASDGAAVLPALAPATETTGSIASGPQAVPDQPVGNTQVFAVQKKLAELRLFDGKVDGYYGPMTARAIRAFEERNGMAPLGALSSEVVSAILNADSAGRAMAPVAPPQPAPVVQPIAQPARIVEPAPVVQPVAVVQPAPVALPQAPVAQPQPDQVIARLPTLSPGEQVFDQVATTAAQTLDSIVAAVDGSRSNPQTLAVPSIPAASLPSQTMPAPVQMASAAPVTVAVVAPTTAPSARVPNAGPPANDAELVSQIQSGLASLGFFRGAIDGNPGPETARAIREFENFHRYRITGQVQPDLVKLLRDAGAAI